MRYAIVILALIVQSSSAFSQEEVINASPGIDRWKIKTSAANGKAKKVSLDKLLALPLLEKKYSTNAYDDQLIQVDLGGGLKEGAMITTQGYLHLVALENSPGDHKDGDYHIQLTLNKEWSDSCFIVEIPYAEFIDAALKDSSANARRFIRSRLLKDKEPTSGGNVMQGTVYVKVTGQLFYDAIHASQMRGANPKYRGKAGPGPMHSYTAWELHPVTHIEFAVRPK